MQKYKCVCCRVGEGFLAEAWQHGLLRIRATGCDLIAFLLAGSNGMLSLDQCEYQ